MEENDHYFSIYTAYHNVRYESGATGRVAAGVFNACGKNKQEALENAKRFAAVAHDHHLYSTEVEETVTR